MILFDSVREMTHNIIVDCCEDIEIFLFQEEFISIVCSNIDKRLYIYSKIKGNNAFIFL